jgi:hypothetical protein
MMLKPWSKPDEVTLAEERREAERKARALDLRRRLMAAAVDAAKPGETWWPALAPLTKAERRFVLAQLQVKP